MRPGTTITTREQAPPLAAPTDTGTLFVVGTTATVPSPDVPVLIRSMAEYGTTFGIRSGAEELYDFLEAYFHEGGSRAYVKAKAAGDLDDVLALIPAELGPGQVAAPDSNTSADGIFLLAHAAAANRVALIQGASDDDATELAGLGAAIAANANARHGAIFAPYATIPGLAGGSSRSVPWTAIVAGHIARLDALGNPNAAAAGDRGQALYATGITAEFTEAQRNTLLLAGVNTARIVYGGARTYGWRTAADEDGPWWQFNAARTHMAITARADAVAERFVFSQIDGKGVTLGEFAGQLSGALIPFYEAGALYGDTAREAFNVDVGPTVNTPETIAAGELRAVIAARTSPHAELVTIEIVKVAVNDAVVAPPLSGAAAAGGSELANP